MSTASTEVSDEKFHAIRGRAIQAYANLEQSLCTLLARLAGTPDDVAAIIFFRITSYRARNTVIEKLFQRKFKSQYNTFRNSLIKQLTPIDNERNEIVHWNVFIDVQTDENDNPKEEVVMTPPNIFAASSPKKTLPDLEAFIAKCDFYSELCVMFINVLFDADSLGWSEANKKPLLDIFQQEIVYPPPAAHPLSRIAKKPRTPQQSSPV